MTLPNAILFPQVMLPLFIFEPRYQKMLRHTLEADRMLAIAMQKPGNPKGTPSDVAGLGLVRAAVTHSDGTSHLILQGLARVQLKESIRQRPFRIARFKLLETRRNDSVAVDALTEKVLDLVSERLKKGFPAPILNQLLKMDAEGGNSSPMGASLENIVEYLAKLENPDQLADLVSCTLLATATQRQVILETVELEVRLKHLIHFLMADLSGKQEE